MRHTSKLPNSRRFDARQHATVKPCKLKDGRPAGVSSVLLETNWDRPVERIQGVPAGGDAYMIKRVMMDKPDREAETILRNCVSAMNAASKILVIDPMLPASTEPHPNWLTDVIMLNTQAGRCRTEADFRNLFSAVGLTLSRVLATRSPNFILEGERQ